ncbi:hypothetical protein J4N45_10140 [Vibrio sp. SCSIO 43140]|uniref:hypothetical protein n=1 Tax=Vibrio sp. SCSIO 43140 TaxID=2819100 RepID=UPI002074B6A0|nr:hypothetical protein [Vibrio sp. SCSIO 43140]USD58889.1 hypothetical protein J4N45_10140 [Vibrio sp. SCSIO 43140]
MTNQSIDPKQITIFGFGLMIIFLALLHFQAVDLGYSLFGLVIDSMMPSALEQADKSSVILKLLPCFAGLLMVVFGTRKTIEAKKASQESTEQES